MPSLHSSLCVLVPVTLAVSTLSCAGGADVTPPSSYTLDLSGLPSPLDDANSSIAFPIDMSAPVKHITERSPSQIVEVYDRVGCWSGSEQLLEQTVVAIGLPPGDVAFVSSIELVLDATQANVGAGVCYGYRSRDGKWSYDLTP